MMSTTPKNTTRKKRIHKMMNKKIYLWILLSIIISGIVFSFYSSTLNKNIIIDIFTSISPCKFFIALLILLLSFVFDGLKNYIVFKKLGQQLSFFSAVNSCFISVYFSIITPFSVGGQPFQILYLTKKGVKSSYATQVIFLRLFEMYFIMFLIDLYYIFFLSNNLILGISKKIIIVGLILTFTSSLLILLGIIFPKFISKIIILFSKIPLINRFIQIDKINNWFSELDYVIKKIFKEHRNLLFFDLIMMFFLLIITSFNFYYSITAFTNLNINFFEFFAINNIINAVAYLTPTPGSSGGYELVFTNFLKSFSTNKELIIKGVLFYRFLTYYLILAAGTVILLLTTFKRKN